MNLVDKVKELGGGVHVFHIDHPSGQKLKEITGLAAILRYELYLDDLRNKSESEEEKSEEF